MPVARSSDWKRATIALLLFSVSFGYLEAAVVAYLRALNEPVRQRFNPAREPDDMFPLLKLDQVKAAGPELVWLLKIELAREAATLFMLAAVGIMVGRNGGSILHRFRDLGYSFLRVFAAVAPLAPLPVDLGLVVLDSCPLGRARHGPRAGLLVHDRSRVRVSGTRMDGPTCAFASPPLAWRIHRRSDFDDRLHVGFSQHHGRRDASSFQLAAIRPRGDDWPRSFPARHFDPQRRMVTETGDSASRVMPDIPPCCATPVY